MQSVTSKQTRSGHWSALEALTPIRWPPSSARDTCQALNTLIALGCLPVLSSGCRRHGPLLVTNLANPRRRADPRTTARPAPSPPQATPAAGPGAGGVVAEPAAAGVAAAPQAACPDEKAAPKAKMVPMDGNEATARVAYAMSDVSFIYPITPASKSAWLALDSCTAYVLGRQLLSLPASSGTCSRAGHPVLNSLVIAQQMCQPYCGITNQGCSLPHLSKCCTAALADD